MVGMSTRHQQQQTKNQQQHQNQSEEASEEFGADLEEPIRMKEQSLLWTKSLANLITITRRPLEPRERRKPRRSPNEETEEEFSLNHHNTTTTSHHNYHHTNHHNHHHHHNHLNININLNQNQQQPFRDQLKAAHKLPYRKQKRLLAMSRQQQQQQQQKQTLNSHASGAASKPTRRLHCMGTRLSTRSMNSNNKQTTKACSLLAVGLVVVLAAALVAPKPAEALDCYHCSSVDDPGCDEAFTSRSNYTDTDCRKHLGPDKQAKVCRKIVQYIEHKKVVIRSCGYIDEHEEKDRKPMCYKRSGTFAIMMESCNCYENNCNSTASLVPNLPVLSLAALLLCSFWILNNNNNNQFSIGGRLRNQAR